MLEREKLESCYHLLEKHKENDFQEFYDLGFGLESTYGCCGQCTIHPFAKLLGIDEDLFRYASCFCGGFGHVDKCKSVVGSAARTLAEMIYEEMSAVI